MADLGRPPFPLPPPPSRPPPASRLATFPARRPLRSSPLAGPALSSHFSEDNEDDSQHDKHTPLTPQSQHPKVQLPEPALLLHPHSSAPNLLEPSARRRFSKAFLESSGPASSASATSSSPALLSPSSAANIPRRQPSLASIPSTTSVASTSSCSSSRSSSPVAPATTGAEAPTISGNRTTRRPNTSPGGSWYTDSPYTDTPRFSRLGLGGQHVVLPISAKEHRRKSAISIENSSNQRNSTATTNIIRRTNSKGSFMSSSPSLISSSLNNSPLPASSRNQHHAAAGNNLQDPHLPCFEKQQEGSLERGQSAPTTQSEQEGPADPPISDNERAGAQVIEIIGNGNNLNHDKRSNTPPVAISKARISRIFVISHTATTTTTASFEKKEREGEKASVLLLPRKPDGDIVGDNSTPPKTLASSPASQPGRRFKTSFSSFLRNLCSRRTTVAQVES